MHDQEHVVHDVLERLIRDLEPSQHPPHEAGVAAIDLGQAEGRRDCDRAVLAGRDLAGAALARPGLAQLGPVGLEGPGVGGRGRAHRG